MILFFIILEVMIMPARQLERYSNVLITVTFLSEMFSSEINADIISVCYTCTVI